MDDIDFRETARNLIGTGWQTRLSEALGVDGSTVRRWVGNALPVPSTVMAYLRMMVERQQARGALVFERQPDGTPIAGEVVIEGDGVNHPRLNKKLIFPGVDFPKQMPAIHAGSDDDGVLTLSLGNGGRDAIDAPGVSLVLTRHPDPYHRDAYIEAATTRGHKVVWVEYRHHFYTLLAHLGGTPRVTHQIATHAGRIRTLWSEPSEPARIVDQALS